MTSGWKDARRFDHEHIAPGRSKAHAKTHPALFREINMYRQDYHTRPTSTNTVQDCSTL